MSEHQRFALSTAFVVAAAAIGWFNAPAAVIMICATVLAALQGKASSLVEFSFGPVKAKLERELSEAEALVGKLRKMALVQARTTIAASARTGRWADESDWQFVNLRAIEAALRDIGVNDEALTDARSDLVRHVARDLGMAAIGGGNVPIHLGGEVIAEWHAIARKGLSLTPDDVDTFLRRHGIDSTARVQRVEDMRWVLEHHNIRDREQYLRSMEPVEWIVEGRN